MITISEGQSGYFSKPVNVLDPHLFDGDHLKSEVRARLQNLLLDYLDIRYSHSRSWTMVWLAGSGISYQWSSARGNGDLDILFGIDYSQFVTDNPEFAYDSREEIAAHIDNDLKKNLWPITSHEYFYADNGWDYQVYEVTFFLNPLVEDNSDSIVNIHPYAAYNITTDEWIVRPPKSPAHIDSLFETQVQANNATTKALVDRYNAVNQEVTGPQAVNNAARKKLIVQEARNLFDSIHLGRKTAFSSQGEGYSDFYNYQWQKAKADGIITALQEIIAKEN